MSLALTITVALLLMLLAPILTPRRAKAATLNLFDVAAAPQPRPASPKPRQPRPIPPVPPQPVVVPPLVVPLPVPNDAVVALLEQSEAAATGGACDLTAPVQAALQADEAVMASLPTIPSEQRSVANAITVWNQNWLAPDGHLDANAMVAIRDVVAGVIAMSSPECRLQPQGGPRLIILPGEPKNTVLALGSGEWRWQDLLETARPDWPEDALLRDKPPMQIAAGTRHDPALRTSFPLATR